MQSQIERFAELGRLFRGLQIESFADTDRSPVSDPEVIEEVRSLLEEEIGSLDQVAGLTIDGSDVLRGRATQRLSLGKSQIYQFAITTGGMTYQMVNAADMAEFGESEEGWAAVLDYATAKGSKGGKKLNCKPGNMQCGGKCQRGDMKCSKTNTPEQKTKVEKVTAKAKSKAGKSKTTGSETTKTKENLLASAAKTEKTTSSKKSQGTKTEAKPIPTEKENAKQKTQANSVNEVTGSAPKPFMSKEEAEEYTKGSVYEGKVFYHATGKAGADSITTEGVDINRNEVGMFGKGFYVGGGKNGREVATGYAAMLHGGAEVLEIRLKVSNPKKFKDASEYLDLTQEKYWEINDVKVPGVRMPTREQRVSQYFKNQGYDAIEITKDGEYVLFDKSQVAVYARSKV